MASDLSIADLAARQVGRINTEREKNRLNFPNAAKLMDALAEFTPKLIWAEEGGKTIGKVPENKLK